MESLALMVTVILVYTMVLGALGVFTIWKTPRNQVVRMAMIVLYLPAIFISAQLTFNLTALTGRIVFGGVTAACVGAIIALIKKPTN
jgi:hypothetical protein